MKRVTCTCSGSPRDPDYTRAARCLVHPPHFVSASCEGEECVVKNCGRPATHKIGEETYDDHPNERAYREKIAAADEAMTRASDFARSAADREEWGRKAESLGLDAMQMPGQGHNLTAYVCCSHFRMVMGPAVQCGETTYDVALTGYEMLMASIAMLRQRADETAARNYVSMQLVGVPAPFDRVYIDLIRPGGKSGHERAEDNKVIILRCVHAMKRLAGDVETGQFVDGEEDERRKAAENLRKFADDIAGQVS